MRPLGETWLAHQRRDAYWRHGSVCEDYGAIRCPVLAIGGWADGYTDAVLRLMQGLDVPRRGIIGPWGHNDTEDGVPGPGAGVLREVVRWFDAVAEGRATTASRTSRCWPPSCRTGSCPPRAARCDPAAG